MSRCLTVLLRDAWRTWARTRATGAFTAQHSPRAMGKLDNFYSLNSMGTLIAGHFLLGLGCRGKGTVFSIWKLGLFRKLEHAINLFINLKAFDTDFLS